VRPVGGVTGRAWAAAAGVTGLGRLVFALLVMGLEMVARVALVVFPSFLLKAIDRLAKLVIPRRLMGASRRHSGRRPPPS
jgi:hypothetical protein